MSAEQESEWDKSSIWDAAVLYCCRCERGYRGYDITWLSDVGDKPGWPFISACFECEMAIDTSLDSLLDYYLDGTFISQFETEYSDLLFSIRRRKSIIKFHARNGRYPPSVSLEEIAAIESESIQ